MFLRKECCKQCRYFKFKYKCQLRSSGIQKYKLNKLFMYEYMYQPAGNASNKLQYGS